jgi:hypothetical protein
MEPVAVCWVYHAVEATLFHLMPPAHQVETTKKIDELISRSNVRK